jgi:hypothetical protein
MKKFIVLFLPIIFLYAPTLTFYSDWDWGYYFWLFGPVGPNHSEGMAAAGYSSLEYRGYNQFTLGGYPGTGIQISDLTLRLRNNTGGSGLQIDINRVFSNTPGWDECGGTAPIYLTNQAVSANAEEYAYFDLTGTQAVDDFVAAWETSSWFGLGYKGSRGSAEPCMHFFYAFWADQMLDAALIVEYVIIGKEDHEPGMIKKTSLSVYPNPCKDKVYIDLGTSEFTGDEFSLIIYDASGQLVKDCHTTPYNLHNAMICWDCQDQSGQKVTPGVYFIRLCTEDGVYIEKIILAR